MTPELVLTRGLPASGKTTFSTAWVNEDPTSRLRVNRDDLRACLYGKPFLDYHGEQAVTIVQHAAITAALGAGKSVVVDDTNLRAKYARALIDLAVAAGASWRVEDFTDVALTVCIDRDAARGAAGGRMVGEDVIRGMYSRYLASGRLPALAPTDLAVTSTTVYVPDETLPPAWLVDVDGTLARMGDRGPFDWHRVSEDTPNAAVVALVRALSPAVDIVVMSGRDGVCEDATAAWLARHGIPCDSLVMRREGDNRKDAIVKHELFWKVVAPHWNVIGVLDDRQQVVDMWRSMGMTCAQVAPGDF